MQKKEKLEMTGFEELSSTYCVPQCSRFWAEGDCERMVDVLTNEDGSTTSPGNFLDWFMSLLTLTFRDIIRCYTFFSYPFPYIYQSVLSDDDLQQIIRSESQAIALDKKCQDIKSMNKILLVNQERAVKLLKKLRSTLSNFVLKVSIWVVLKVSSAMFSSMTVPVKQIDMLKKANASGLPLIFLPLHKSHMDYIAVSSILGLNNIRAPLVAAGENLIIPFFGRVLRGLGAFFIKRRMDTVEGRKDILYRTILRTYMTHCISAGHNFEFFMEGRRSRTGKPSLPKGGLLSIILDAHLNGKVNDALLVPVSVNCEKLVDDSFLNELSGAPKPPESLIGTLSTVWSGMTVKHGHVRVNFCQPTSLKELVRSLKSRINPKISRDILPTVFRETLQLNNYKGETEEQRQLVDAVARHIVYDCNHNTSILPTNAVSFLLLYVCREGVTLSELLHYLDTLKDELTAAGKNLAYMDDGVYAVNNAISLLGPSLVLKEKRDNNVFVKPITSLPAVHELTYYSNIVLSQFSLEAIISLSVLTLSQESGLNEFSQEKILESCRCLSQILQFEFIFHKPCRSLYDNLQETIERIGIDKILQAKDVNKAQSKLEMYSGLIRPLIDTYSVTAHCLYKLHEGSVTEKEFIKYSLDQVRCRVDNGHFKYGESVSTETVQNSIHLFESLDIVRSYYLNGIKMLVLKESRDKEETEKLIKYISDLIQRFQINNNNMAYMLQ